MFLFNSRLLKTVGVVFTSWLLIGLLGGTTPMAQTRTEPPRLAGAYGGITKGITSAGEWMARVDADFVQLSNGRVNVYLFYPFQLTDQQRGDYDLADHCWKTFVVPRFNISSAQKFTDSVPDITNWLYYIEGNGSAKGSGKSEFIAMKASAQGGIVSVIVVVAADRQTYKQTFPDPKGLSFLKGVNHFALSTSDVIGTWSDSAGFGLSFVNSDTGNFAGMSTSANSNEFTFNSSGTYQSKHAYASTSASGGIRGGKEQHNGRFSVTDWELTVTGTAGTITYSAYFEAVKNGRILHLTQKGAAGNQFHLGLVR